MIEVDDIELGDPAFWMRFDEREAAFAKLRAEKPLPFMKEFPTIIEGFAAGPGFWAVTKHADAVHVSRHPEIFCSGEGYNIFDVPKAINDFFGSMIGMDAPEHTRLRMIVNRRFTPKQVRRIEDIVQQTADDLIDRVKDKPEINFVDEIAARLPLTIICRMMGIPEEHYDTILKHTNYILSGGDPEWDVSLEATANAGFELSQIVSEIGEQRMKEPQDDLITTLVTAEKDGEPLTPAELGSFFILLVVAGSETTRNALAWGLYELTNHPEQKKLWMSDFDRYADAAVEEIVRWSTPVMHFRRTATEDTELAGQPIKAGEKVVIWYNSANRDEDVFDEPQRFDITRSPNEHVGFGAGGPHFCLGANLARQEIKIMFREIFDRMPTLEASSEPDRLRSPFINGIKRMRATH